MERHCPVCNNMDKELIMHVKMCVPEDYLLPSEFDVVNCTKCGFIFSNTIYSDAYDMFYSSMTGTTTTDYTISEDEHRLNTDTADFLINSGSITKESKILDVGCSYGALISVLKERGYHNLAGMDLDQSAIAYLKKKNIAVIVGSIFSKNLEQLEGTYDVIVLRHILEHLHNPREAIQNISRLLKKDGKLLIETPDLRLYRQCSPFPGYFAENHHINHFSLISLMNMMNEWDLLAYESKALIYPTLRAVFTRGYGQIRSICKEENDRESMCQMLYYPNEESKKFLARIDGLEHKEIAIWGTSVFVHRTLTCTKLIDCNIKFFVDKNEELQGKRIMGKVIESPKELKNFAGTIVICGKSSLPSIQKAILDMNLKNDVVCLSEDIG